MLAAPVQREVTVVGMRRLRNLKTYTVPEAAEALGKSLSNFRRWIDNGLIPAPNLKDASRGYLCYCQDELQIMARILVIHEREFAYFCETHETTSNLIWEQITGYRDITFGGGND